MRVLFSLLVGAHALSISTKEEYNEEFNLAEHEEELASFLQVTAEDEDDASASFTAEQVAAMIQAEEMMENGDKSAFFQTEDWFTNATDSALLQEPISWSDRSFGAWSVTPVPSNAECKQENAACFYINQNDAHRQYGRVIKVGGAPTERTRVYWVFDKPVGTRVEKFLKDKHVKAVIINIWTVTDVSNGRHVANRDFGAKERNLRIALRSGLNRNKPNDGSTEYAHPRREDYAGPHNIGNSLPFDHVMNTIENHYVTGGWRQSRPRTMIGHSNGGFLAMYISAKYPAYLSEIVVMDPGIGMASIEYWRGSNEHINDIVRNLCNKMRATQSQNPRMKRWIYGKSMGTVAPETDKSLRVKEGLLYMEDIAEPQGLMETLFIIKPPAHDEARREAWRKDPHKEMQVQALDNWWRRSGKSVR